jgi:hypothetical protein
LIQADVAASWCTRLGMRSAQRSPRLAGTAHYQDLGTNLTQMDNPLRELRQPRTASSSSRDEIVQLPGCRRSRHRCGSGPFHRGPERPVHELLGRSGAFPYVDVSPGGVVRAHAGDVREPNGGARRPCRSTRPVRATGQPPREQHLGLMGSVASERIAQFFMRSPGVSVSVNDSAVGKLRARRAGRWRAISRCPRARTRPSKLLGSGLHKRPQ